MLFQNILFLREFLHAMTVLGYLPKLKLGLVLDFGAHFLHDFCRKIFLFNTALMYKFQSHTLFPSHDVKQNLWLSSYLDNWWYHKL